MTVYSFKDLVLVISDPDVGPFTSQGQIGFGQLTIEMATEKTEHNVAADGNVMVSAIAGDNGHINIEVQQTSDLHTYLVKWYNAKKAALNNNDVSTFAATRISARNMTDGSQHTATGISPSRLAPKTYAARGGMITWSLMAADVQTVNVPVPAA